jgi:hypothetical protein
MKHVTQLCQMPQTKKGDATSLRQLINHIRSNVNAIQALTLNTPMHDLILNHLLLSGLDSETHKTWEIHASEQEDIPSTTEVLQFLENHCKALELLQTSQLTTVTTAPSKHTSSSDNVSRTASTYMTSHIQCLICKKSHRLIHCDKFIHLSPQRRVEWACQHKLCYNCLQVFSKDHVCSTFKCQKCGRRHHTLLHVTAPNQPANNNSSSPSKPVSNRSASPVTTYCSFKGKPTIMCYLPQQL